MAKLVGTCFLVLGLFVAVILGNWFALIAMIYGCMVGVRYTREYYLSLLAQERLFTKMDKNTQGLRDIALKHKNSQ